MPLISKYQLYSYLLFFVLIAACSNTKKKKINHQHILAVVGTDTIFVNDLIKRSEYIIRPPYCDGKSSLDKSIILNSIIAEHLFALEAKNFKQSKVLKAKLQGIKEQLMREKLIYEEVINKINIPTEEINQAYQNSKKLVHTEAVFIPTSYNPEIIYNSVLNGLPFEEINTKYPGVSKKVSKDIKWGHIDEAAQKEIFNSNVKKGTILKPIKSQNGFRLIKIIGWSEEIELSPGNVNLQKQSIKDKLMDYYIQKNYTSFSKNVMKGKQINFDRGGWNIFSEALKYIYLIEDEKKRILNNENPSESLQNSFKKPLMKIDDEIWTIEKTIEAIKVHPLEISDDNIDNSNYPQRLQSAIAGLITDTYLTRLALKKKYDKSNSVQRGVKEWERFSKFTFERNRYLSEKKFTGTITKDFLNAFDELLNPFFDSLKIKYDSIITINKKALEKIELTNLPTTTHKTKGPYKQVVPAFPLVTNSHKINYRLLTEEK